MNTIYENQVIENKMTDLLNTRLDTRALMTIDTSLSENAGLKKVINRYSYNGKVEKLAKGDKNSVKGTVSFVPEYYSVKRYQQTFEYNDMDAMADPYIVDVAMQGAITEISNEINEEYFEELLKISSTFGYDYDGVTYSDIVDALASIDCEVDSDLFILMDAEARKSLRKDPDFIAAKQGEIMYSGQFGTICGIPVLYSKLVPKNKIIVTNKDAVRFFVKKEASVEQARDIETKDNTVVYERHGLIALVDDTRSLILGRKPKKLEGITITRTDSQTLKGTTGEGFKFDDTKHILVYRLDYDGPAILDGETFVIDDWISTDPSSMIIYDAFSHCQKLTIVKINVDSYEAVGIFEADISNI